MSWIKRHPPVRSGSASWPSREPLGARTRSVFEVLSKASQTPRSLLEVALLTIHLVGVDRFAPAVDRDLHTRPEMPDNVLSPIERDGHVTADAALFE